MSHDVILLVGVALLYYALYRVDCTLGGIVEALKKK